jgi:hypothetical protein
MYYLFFVNPFLALIYALRDLRRQHAKNILWLFVVFLGFTYALRPDSRVDTLRYAKELELLHRMDISFWEYQSNSGDVDFFSNWLLYNISRFTDSGSVLIICQSIIFGYFFSRNMTFVFEKLNGTLKPITRVLFLSFFLIMPLWTFGGFRFNTAIHVFVYGLLHYFFNRERRFLIWCFVTPFLFHYAFLLPTSLLVAYLFLGNRVTIYFGFYVFSLFFAEFDLKTFNAIFEQYMPAKIQERSSGYRSEKVYQMKQEAEAQGIFGGKQSWHAILYRKSLFWSISLFLIYLFLNRKRLSLLDSNFISILSYVLLFGGFANFLINLPTGQRYSLVVALISMAFITIYIQNSGFDRIGHRLSILVAPFLIFFILVSAREGFYYFSLTTLLGNPIVALFSLGNNINLDYLIKG